MKNQPDYALILAQLTAATESERDAVANLANAAAVLNMNLEDVNWVGFYLIRGEQLVLGPFQGRPACVRIDFGKGVCGTAVLRDTTMVVSNVHEFEGHIACDGASNSEIVIPLRRKGKPVAVLDIDSPLFDRFTEADKEGLEKCAALLEQVCEWELSPDKLSFTTF